MNEAEIDFPEQRRIWEGAVLASIAHAVFVLRFPDFAHEHSWEGSNYSVQDTQGSRATIAFSWNRFVAAFFLDDSPRNPFRAGTAYDHRQYFSGLPSELRALAYDEACQYLLEDYHGGIVPIVTSAFWGDGLGLRCSGCEPWPEIVRHGACLIRNQLEPAERALAKWREELELTEKEASLARSLYELRISDPNGNINLTNSERYFLHKRAIKEEGVVAARESFAEIGIIL